MRPTRRDEPGRGPHLAPIRQRIESIFWTCKDLLTLERHGARTLAGLRERVAQRFLCLAACVWLNHQLGRPSRSLVAYGPKARGINHLVVWLCSDEASFVTGAAIPVDGGWTAQ